MQDITPRPRNKKDFGAPGTYVILPEPGLPQPSLLYSREEGK